MARAAPPIRTAIPSNSLHFTACRATAPEDLAVAIAEAEAEVLDGAEEEEGEPVLPLPGWLYILVAELPEAELVAVELDPVFATTTPPPTEDGVVEFPVFAAFAANTAKVLPDAGSLMTPTIPDWQCFV
jgi:hypothetical protein